MKKRFSVIVVHRNNPRRLLSALASIRAAANPEIDEIIVVDNHSSDDSIAQARTAFPNVIYIENPCNAGYAKACNQGMAVGNGEFFLICNNDLILQTDTLDLFASVLDAYPRCSLLGAHLHTSDGAPIRSGGQHPGFWRELLGLRLKEKPLALDPHQMPAAVRVDKIVGACIAVRRSAVEQVGTMDEDFNFYFEDTEWCLRMTRGGWDVMWAPAIKVTHARGGSTHGLHLPTQVEYARSRLLYMKKTKPFWQYMILSVIGNFSLAADVVFYGLMTLCSVGLLKKYKEKFLGRSAILAWLLLGRPDSWGLPDKCKS